jgi:hypothetical protein
LSRTTSATDAVFQFVKAVCGQRSSHGAAFHLFTSTDKTMQAVIRKYQNFQHDIFNTTVERGHQRGLN